MSTMQGEEARLEEIEKKIEKEYAQTVRREPMLLKHLVMKGKRKKNGASVIKKGHDSIVIR